jgi:hypothetical protein
VRLTKFLYNLIYNFPNINTLRINQLAWMYQKTYSDLGLNFKWAKGRPSSVDIDLALANMLTKRCTTTIRPHGGRPKIAYRWTVDRYGPCHVYQETWELAVRETFKYYLEPDNARELRIKVNLLRIRRPSFYAIHRECLQNRRLRRRARRRRGRRGNPIRIVALQDIRHRQ